MKNKKKGQEEMVGFIVIVVIVTIIALVLLLLTLRKSVGIESSQEVENFIHSTSYFTTECEVTGRVMDIERLVVSCFRNERCENGENTCDVLNETLVEIIEEGLGTELYSGYEVKVYASEGSGDEEEVTPILEIKSGQEVGNSQSGDVLFSQPGRRFHIYLKLYYATS